jgi:hypothetical protein
MVKQMGRIWRLNKEENVEFGWLFIGCGNLRIVFDLFFGVI